MRQLESYRRHLRALGQLVARRPAVKPVVPTEDSAELAQVVSLAALRAQRLGHPSAGGRAKPAVPGVQRAAPERPDPDAPTRKPAPQRAR